MLMQKDSRDLAPTTNIQNVCHCGRQFKFLQSRACTPLHFQFREPVIRNLLTVPLLYRL